MMDTTAAEDTLATNLIYKFELKLITLINSHLGALVVMTLLSLSLSLVMP